MAPEKASVGLDRIVDLAHRHLGLDLVYITERRSDELLFRALAGDTGSFDVTLDQRRLWDGTLSQLLVEGKIPPVIPDTAADGRVADLRVTRSFGVGAFIGIPLRLEDGTLCGTLCGVDHDPDPTLGERDVRFMTMLGELVI